MLILCKIWLGKLHLWPLEVSPIDHVMSTVRYSVYLSIEMTTLIGSFLYVLSNLGDIDEATEPGFVCFAFGTTVFIYVWLVSKKHLIESAIDKLELCVNARNTKLKDGFPDAKTGYEETEIEYTKLTLRYIYSWSIIVLFYGCVLLVVPANDIYHGQMDASNWTTLFKLTFPLDERKMSSFFIHYALDFMTTFIHFTIYSASCIFHTATALYVSAMVLDTRSILERCDAFLNSSNLPISERSTKIQSNYYEAISLHANILELAKLLTKIMSGVLFIMIANSIIFMAVGLFQMETKTKAGAFEVYVSLNSVMLQTALIWFFCYHSALVTQRLDEIGDYAYSLKWYRYSEVSQKPTLMLIRQSNKRLTYSGLGIFRCDMQTFSMMVNSVVSYYLLLKKI